MGEHLPCKQGVDSSSLFISTKLLLEASANEETVNREGKGREARKQKAQG